MLDPALPQSAQRVKSAHDRRLTTKEDGSILDIERFRSGRPAEPLETVDEIGGVDADLRQPATV